MYNLLGRNLPTDLRFDMHLQPTQRGPNEYAKTAEGKEVRLRSLDADGRTWKYTTAGRQFYAQPRSQCVIQIPVTIHGTSSELARRTIGAKTSCPSTNDGLPWKPSFWTNT